MDNSHKWLKLWSKLKSRTYWSWWHVSPNLSVGLPSCWKQISEFWGLRKPNYNNIDKEQIIEKCVQNANAWLSGKSLVKLKIIPDFSKLRPTMNIVLLLHSPSYCNTCAVPFWWLKFWYETIWAIYDNHSVFNVRLKHLHKSEHWKLYATAFSAFYSRTSGTALFSLYQIPQSYYD